MTCFTRFHADLCGKVTGGLLLAAVFSPATARAQTQGDTSWQGAWHWIHESNDGRLILLEDWFCGVFGRKDRTVPPPGELSESQAAELFRSTAGPMCGPVLVSSTVEDPIILETVSRIAARPRNHGSRAIRPTRVEGSKMYSDLLRADGSVSVTWNYNRLDAPGTSPLAGVWELDSDSWEGIMLITDTQYRYAIGMRERASFESSSGDLTDEQAAYLYSSYDAQGGTFSVSGDLMTRRPAVAKDPRLQGREIVGSFQLDGATLTTEFGETRLTWRRAG